MSKLKALMSTKIAKIIICVSAGLLAVGAATTITIFYIPHNVKLNSECLEIVNGSTARLASDYHCSFKIKDSVIKTRYMDNMNVFSVKVNGNEIPPEDYSFIYQTNGKNEFTINKKHLNGNVEINADLVTRMQKHNSYYFGYYLEDECNLPFENVQILYPDNPSRIGDKNALIEAGTETIDNILMDSKYDAARLQKGDAPLGLNFPALIAREDNIFILKFTAVAGTTLPKNIWYNTNARFALKGEDFTMEYSSDYKEAIMTIPYFVVRDSGFIQLNPDVEAI